MVQATSARKKMVYATYPNLAHKRVSIAGGGSGRDYFVDAGWYGA